MRYFNQFIIGVGLLSSSMAYAIDFYAEALYWQASETVDWALTNNLSLPNQVISYKTIDFNFTPGFRIGAGLHRDDWHSRALYTRFTTAKNASTSGNVISAFMAGKFAETFYNTGQVHFAIDFNMFDVDLYKDITIDPSLTLKPVLGLKGGWINQRVNTAFQGDISVFEAVTNDFSGIGPKAGIEGQWNFYTAKDYKLSLIAEAASAYMWGNWSISDVLTQNNSSQNSDVVVPRRDMGALALQGLVGLKMEYPHYSVQIGYEVSDWFNQFQVFDNATGTHSNDLVLQGLGLSLHYFG